MRLASLPFTLLSGALAVLGGCELRAKVGELRPTEGAAVPSTVLPPQSPVDGGRAGALSWQLRAPMLPCSIYAMAETRADALFLGCNGGRIYRFDGVDVELSLAVEDTRIFSLLWAKSDGSVWAGAQSGFDANATTQLYRFDGKVWTKVGGDDERLLLLTGSPDGDIWTATSKELRRIDDAGAKTSFTVTGGELRACAFASANDGYCGGTNGLAVRWNGQAWQRMTGAPWTSAAEVFGIELGWFKDAPLFLYGEPVADPHGNTSVRAARWTGTAFASYRASIPAFSNYYSSRKRTNQVNIEGSSYALLALDEQYGRALRFDPHEDEFRTLCGAMLAFSAGSAKTRVGGFHGLLATIVGAGSGQIALASESDVLDFSDLSVGSDGAAWARVTDSTVCGSASERIVRFDEARWRGISAPQPAQSGRALAAISRERVFTLALFDRLLLEYTAGAWHERAHMNDVNDVWSLSATAPDDVWIGGYRDGLGHFDGKDLEIVEPGGRGRQIVQVTSDGADTVWMVAIGYTKEDTGVHVYRRAEGEVTEWDLGLTNSSPVRVAAIDSEHAWMSGSPAKVWDGARWNALPFDASAVWARSADEVYFTKAGDIHRWDGSRLERVYHGFIPIRFIDGAASGGIAVGPGGLTIELAGSTPENTK